MSLASHPNADCRGNRVLSLLDPRTLAAFDKQLEFVPLEVPQVLESEGKPIRYAYFPTDGVASILASTEGTEKKIEVGTIGREGMVGLSLFLGATVASGDGFVQVAGNAWRIPAAAFVEATETLPGLAAVLRRYAHSYLVQVSQTAACNRVHSPEQRCARWLLMTQDRVGGDTFKLKQEFLGMMLGERRVTVSKAESNLKDRGIVSYSRGNITVVDRERLEAASCPCYAVIRKASDNMSMRSHAAESSTDESSAYVPFRS